MIFPLCTLHSHLDENDGVCPKVRKWNFHAQRATASCTLCGTVSNEAIVYTARSSFSPLFSSRALLGLVPPKVKAYHEDIDHYSSRQG